MLQWPVVLAYCVPIQHFSLEIGSAGWIRRSQMHQWRCSKAPASIGADFSKSVTALPRGTSGCNLVCSPGYKIPPHQDRFRKRRPADQQYPGASRAADGNLPSCRAEVIKRIGLNRLAFDRRIAGKEQDCRRCAPSRMAVPVPCRCAPAPQPRQLRCNGRGRHRPSQLSGEHPSRSSTHLHHGNALDMLE
jgi:hypothetical protein